MAAPPTPATPAVPSRPASVPPRGLTGTDGLLAIMTLIWGVNYIVIKASFAVLTPLAFNSVRFTVAALAVVAIATVAKAPRPPRALLPRLAVLGILGNTVYQLAYIEGMARTRAGNAALIAAASPAMTAVASHFLGHERLRWRDAAGVALSTTGIAVLILGSGEAVRFGRESGAVVGDLLMVVSAVCWTSYTIGAKRVVDELGPTVTTAWTMGLGAIPLLVICTPAAVAQPWHAVPLVAWVGTVFSALGALVVAYLIWYRGVARLGATRTAIYSNFTPVVTLLSAWPLLGEVPSVWQLCGAAGIFGSLALIRS